jgi:hypothetical protein
MKAMLSLPLARQLQQAGLIWTPARNDFFVVPDRGLDETVFVLTDMTVMLEKIHGQPAISFHGVAEWALDYVMMAEVVWLPSEGQLRDLATQYLVGEPEPALTLASTTDGYRCMIQFQGKLHTFDAFGASECYGLALLHLLQHSPPPRQ